MKRDCVTDRDRDVMENHWESTRTPLSLSLSLNLFLSNTPTRLIWYLIQASRMCEGPNKNRHTKHWHCTSSTLRLTCSSVHADLDQPSPLGCSVKSRGWWPVALLFSHYRRGGKKKARKWQSIAGNESHDADTQLQHSGRVGQGQVVASSLTCC